MKETKPFDNGLIADIEALTKDNVEEAIDKLKIIDQDYYSDDDRRVCPNYIDIFVQY